MTEIRVGLLGSGFMGRTNAETVSRYLPGSRLTAIAGGTRCEALASEYGVDCESSPEALLHRRDIDAVFISTPHAEHGAQALTAVRTGKHVLLDKPMAASVEECDKIISAAEASGARVMIMFGQRFRKVNREAHRLIRKGAIGNIQAIYTSALNVGGLGSLPPWQSRPENLGTLFGHGVHNIDLVRWFTGDEVQSVSARIQRDPVSGNEVSTMAVLGMRGGTMATVWVSWTIPSPGFPHSGFSAKVVGTEGLLDLDAYGVLRLGRSGAWETVTEQAAIDFRGKGMLDPVRLEAYALQGNEFLNAIRERRPPSVTGDDGRAAVEIALAAYRSSDEDRTVALKRFQR